MGYVMMNWSSELMKQAKKRKRVEMRKRKRDEEERQNEEQRQQREHEEQQQKTLEEQKGAPCSRTLVHLAVRSSNRFYAVAIDEYVSRISHLESELASLRSHQDEVKRKLEATKGSLVSAIERENKFRWRTSNPLYKWKHIFTHIIRRSENESLRLEEAQVRFELKELSKTLEEELDKREKEHEQQVQLLEEVKYIL